jgi:DtxR family Mn-dependent transcriptional regulator
MLDHNTIETSESEEMYLITIARLVEQGVPEPVSISRLAAELSIQPVSANQMVHKLAEEGLVQYLPYKGVRLTAHGRSAAQQVLRDRRLWEVFLVEYLELPPSEADALACRLEHITVEGVTGRLAKFLGYPSVSPQGFPIPDAASKEEQPSYGSLADLAVGELAEVMRLSGEPTVRKFLESEGVRPGTEVSLLARGKGNALLFAVGENQLELTRMIADKVNIIIKNRDDNDE